MPNYVMCVFDLAVCAHGLMGSAAKCDILHPLGQCGTEHKGIFFSWCLAYFKTPVCSGTQMVISLLGTAILLLGAHCKGLRSCTTGAQGLFTRDGERHHQIQRGQKLVRNCTVVKSGEKKDLFGGSWMAQGGYKGSGLLHRSLLQPGLRGGGGGAI